MRKLSLFVALVGLSLSALFSGTAFGHSGAVHLDENCNVWHARVELAHNVTPDRLVFVTTSIPGTTGILNGHYDTSKGLIWSATGPYPASGTVALVIYKPKGNSWALEFTDTEVLTAPSCDPTTTTTAHVTTTTAHDNRCDVNHPGEGQDNDQGHNNPDCVTTTTSTTTESTSTTVSTSTTTLAPTTTTTVQETTTTDPEVTLPSSTTLPPTTSTTTVTASSSTSLPPTTTSTTGARSSAPTTAAGVTSPSGPAGSLPRTGGNDSVPFQVGLVLFALGTIALAFAPRRHVQ
jgi:hypothetical protein